MQAIVQDNYGPGNTLELRQVERPRIGDHEVLVRVRAAFDVLLGGSTQAAIGHATSSISVELSCDKEFTKQILDDASLPVPAGAR